MPRRHPARGYSALTRRRQDEHTIDDDARPDDTAAPTPTERSGGPHRRRGIRRRRSAPRQARWSLGDRRRDRDLRGLRARPGTQQWLIARSSRSSRPSSTGSTSRAASCRRSTSRPASSSSSIFQVFVLVYTGYIAFTNYGTGHNGSKEQAVSSLMASSLAARRGLAHLPRDRRRPPRRSSACSSPTPTATPSSAPTDEPLERGRRASSTATRPSPSTAGRPCTFADVIARTDEITALAVPFSDDPNDGALRTPDGSSAYLYLSTLEYDEAAGTMTEHRDRHRLLRHRHRRVHRPRTARNCCPAGRSPSASTTSCARSPTRASAAARLRHRSGPSRSRSSRSRRRSSSASSSRSSSTTCACAAASSTASLMILPYAFPSFLVGAGLGGHDERELRLHQPGAARRGRHPLAHGPMAGQGLACCS